MNKLLLIVMAVLCTLLNTTDVRAQFRWNGAVEIGLSQNQNLFKSPDRLENQGERLEEDRLYQNDMIIPLDVDAGIEYRSTTHRLELDYAGSMDRHDRYGNLNGAVHSLRLRDTWNVSNSVAMQLFLEGRTSKKIGTNALGDQLARIFEYTSARSSIGMDWDLSKRYSFGASYSFSYRDYTESLSSPSLDSYTHRAVLEWMYKSRRKQGTYWQADIEAEYRLKAYLSYQARNEIGHQLETHPINKLHHFSLELGLRRALTRKLLIQFEMAGRYRYDFFEGYYSYGAGSIEGGFTWEPVKRVTLEGTVGARRIHYFTKVAPQADTFVSPLLRYRYLNGDISIQYDVISWVSFEAFASTSNRYSNATLASRLTRRSYETMEAGASLTLDLDRALR